MKFKDIKAGDTVYIQKGVKPSLFDNSVYFWIPAQVERITPSQFIIGEKQYRKIDGRAVGGSHGKAHLLGSGAVCDESKEMKDFVMSIRFFSLLQKPCL